MWSSEKNFSHVALRKRNFSHAALRRKKISRMRPSKIKNFSDVALRKKFLACSPQKKKFIACNPQKKKKFLTCGLQKKNFSHAVLRKIKFLVCNPYKKNSNMRPSEKQVCPSLLYGNRTKPLLSTCNCLIAMQQNASLQYILSYTQHTKK